MQVCVDTSKFEVEKSMRADKNDPNIFYPKCDFCGSEYQYSEHIFNGHYLKYYELNACKGCVPDIRSDIPPVYENICVTKLVELKKELPQRNNQGTLPAFVS